MGADRGLMYYFKKEVENEVVIQKEGLFFPGFVGVSTKFLHIDLWAAILPKVEVHDGITICPFWQPFGNACPLINFKVPTVTNRFAQREPLGGENDFQICRVR